MTTVDDIVDGYLRRLRGALRDLPREQRREILQEIEGHIAEARGGPDDEGEAAIRTTLDRLGEPEEIAAEARERHGAPRRSLGALEVWALILLLVGGVLLPGLGWFIGVALLWSSTLWSSKEKLIGTLLLPGGLAAAAGFLFLSYETSATVCRRVPGAGPGVRVCEGGGGVGPLELAYLWGAFAVLIVVPMVTTIYLARRARARALASA